MEDIRNQIIKDASGLVETCVAYSMNKTPNADIKKDMIQECYLWLCTYDIDKLADAYNKKHLNALISSFIHRQWFSKNSPFYTKYKRFDLSSDEITQKELDIPDDSL